MKKSSSAYDAEVTIALGVALALVLAVFAFGPAVAHAESLLADTPAGDLLSQPIDLSGDEDPIEASRLPPQEPTADAAGAEPFVVWLFFGDGKTAPGTPSRNSYCPDTTKIPADHAPVFGGKLVARDEAIKRVQAQVDLIHQDFNIIFTRSSRWQASSCDRGAVASSPWTKARPLLSGRHWRAYRTWD